MDSDEIQLFAEFCFIWFLKENLIRFLLLLVCSFVFIFAVHAYSGYLAVFECSQCKFIYSQSSGSGKSADSSHKIPFYLISNGEGKEERKVRVMRNGLIS